MWKGTFGMIWLVDNLTLASFANTRRVGSLMMMARSRYVTAQLSSIREEVCGRLVTVCVRSNCHALQFLLSLKLGVEPSKRRLTHATKKGGFSNFLNRNAVQSGDHFSTGDAWQQRVAVDGLCADAVLMLFTCAHRSI